MDFSEYIRKLHTRTIYTDYIAEEQRIAQGCGCKSYYNGHTLQQGERLDILTGQMNTTPAETSTILGSYNANCPGGGPPPPPPPPPLPSTIVVDCTGVDFSAGGSIASTFTYVATSTINIEFINNASANTGSVHYMQFDTYALPNFVPGDTFTLGNPTYIPTPSLILFGPGNAWSRLYTDESFGMTTTSFITLKTANEYSTIFFNMY